MPLPLVSIVTVSFNQARWLEEAMQSVLNQNYPRLQYIVVDPGSSDGSRDIIERYRERLSAVIYEPDNGAAQGLNRGFALATGDYYYYLNSDDLLLPGAVREAVVALQKYKSDVVYGHGLVIDGDGRVLRKCLSDNFSPRRAAYGAAVVVQPSTFFRRAVFERVGGFNESNVSSWDGELLIDMALKGASFRRVSSEWSSYRLHSTSITASARLRDAQVLYSKRMIEKVTRRNWAKRDALISFSMRIYKHLTSPHATWERISKGPIYGRLGV